MRLEKESFKRIEESYNRTRELRHDLKNHIFVLKGIAENGTKEEMLSYLEKMTDAVEEATYVSMSKNSAVDAILNEKLLYAQKNGTSTQFDVTPLENTKISAMDICTILSNALDNAVEACVKFEKPSDRYIDVKIEDNEMGLVKGLREGIVTITVKSTFDENLSASITVTVSFDKSDIDVHFTHNSTGAYQVSDAILDLKTITDFSDEFKDKYSEDVRFEQFVYKLETNSKYVDSSKLNEGILIFDEKQNLILIKVGIYLNSDPDTLIDEITIAYKK
jgi:hypothetical protein